MGQIYILPVNEEQKKHNIISRNLKRQFSKQRTEHKLLLLGSGESGKTTILRHLLLDRGNGFTPQFKKDQQFSIYCNLLQGTISLCLGVKNILNQDLATPELTNAFQLVCRQLAGNPVLDIKYLGSMQPPPGYSLSPDVMKAIILLWDSAQIKAVYPDCLKDGSYNLPDTYITFVEKLRSYPAWGGPKWLPSSEECLLPRQRTTGMAVQRFYNDKNAFELIDVGGQRSERRKWLHLFEGVTAVIFVSSLSEYDQTLWEESTVNRLQESLHLFQEHANSPYFQKSAFILMLNKVDLFRKKYVERKIPINGPDNLFPDAPTLDQEKPRTIAVALKWFVDKFSSQTNIEERPVEIHITNALDRVSMRTVIDACAVHLLQRSLVESGLGRHKTLDLQKLLYF